MTEKVAYLVAAGLFAAVAGLQVGSNRAFDATALLMLAAAIVFGWLGVRKRSDGDDPVAR